MEGMEDAWRITQTEDRTDEAEDNPSENNTERIG